MNKRYYIKLVEITKNDNWTEKNQFVIEEPKFLISKTQRFELVNIKFHKFVNELTNYLDSNDKLLPKKEIRNE